MSDGIDETIDVFGEAFMKLLRSRLELHVYLTQNGLESSLTISLVDNKGEPNNRFVHEGISAKTVVLQVMQPLTSLQLSLRP